MSGKPHAAGTRLRLVIAGTGRDGTVSLSHMIRRLYEDAGVDGSVMHEYSSREFLHAHTSFLETGDPKWMGEIHALIDECPHDCIVGAGYAPILPAFVERCGPGLTLVHLRRLDRTRAIASLVENCAFFPRAYGYYSDSPEATTKRMTAFHCGEVTPEEWRKLSQTAKLAWYFDKTHALIDEYKGLFSQRLEFYTEHLNDEATRKILAELVLGHSQVVAKPTHVNAHFNFEGLPENRRSKLQWLMGQLNLHQVAYDDVYPLEYFANAFVGWTGYQIRRAPQVGPEDHKTADEISDSLARAERILARHLKDVSSLKEQLAQATASARKD
jgi:hypothetical protein